MINRSDSELLNHFGRRRIGDRQVDELIGLARGMAADGTLNNQEILFLERWLSASYATIENPLIGTLYRRIRDIISDGDVDDDERKELLSTLNGLASSDFELGEVMKSTSLPLCDPVPTLAFAGNRYCFTGTFVYGTRARCEEAVSRLGAGTGSLTQKTTVLVIGTYVTESWKHETFGNKILQAVAWRDEGRRISIVSENHWASALSSGT